MALAQKWCANQWEEMRHWWIEFDGFFSCRWCGETMNGEEADEWMKKYAQEITPPRKFGLREGGLGE